MDLIYQTFLFENPQIQIAALQSEHSFIDGLTKKKTSIRYESGGSSFFSPEA
jgi:hypothetical protein